MSSAKRQKLAPRRNQQKKFMQVGQKGFLVTCNFREKECVKESYNLFNNYYNISPETEEAATEKPSSVHSEDDNEAPDISTQLANEIQASKADAKKQLFQAVDTQTANCIFIETRIPDPLELGVRIVRDIAETKVAKTRFLLRLLPVETVCRANLSDMMQTAERLFDKHFLAEPKSFAIIFNRRYNNDIKRDAVIKEFADIIQAKNIRNKVDLCDPQLAVIVEVIKGFCCLSVVPDYYSLKKYNLVELCGSNANNKKPTAEVDTAKESEEPKTE